MISRTAVSAVSCCTDRPSDESLTVVEGFRQVSRLSRPTAFRYAIPQVSRLTPQQIRSLSSETKAAIDKAVGSAPVVLFMKGTPEMPQCGFSRASIQILGLQGVDPKKFTAFNVLEDEELRQGSWPDEHLISSLGDCARWR